MKLSNSVTPLKNILDATIFAQDEFQSAARSIYINSKENVNIKDAFVTLRYAIWNGLTKAQKDKAISHSIAEKVGGYYDYNDNHLDALLRKVLPTTYLIKIVA